ncbi:unnamed protein product [Boreogadus saida]
MEGQRSNNEEFKSGCQNEIQPYKLQPITKLVQLEQKHGPGVAESSGVTESSRGITQHSLARSDPNEQQRGGLLARVAPGAELSRCVVVRRRHQYTEAVLGRHCGRQQQHLHHGTLALHMRLQHITPSLQAAFGFHVLPSSAPC